MLQQVPTQCPSPPCTDTTAGSPARPRRAEHGQPVGVGVLGVQHVERAPLVLVEDRRVIVSTSASKSAGSPAPTRCSPSASRATTSTPSGTRSAGGGPPP